MSNQTLPRIFIFWTGTNELTPNRISAIDNTKIVTKVPVILITTNNLDEWILKDHPIHRAYQYLSLVHKADYLRCYFMYHHGGGYSDIKCQTGSWFDSFLKLNSDSNLMAIGYKEVEGGVAVIDNKQLYKIMSDNYFNLIGNGAYICKPRTSFTKKWYDNLHKKLDEKYELLKENPASHHRDHAGLWLGDKRSKYPLQWTEILGQIFHPLVYEYSSEILKNLPAPIFTNYL